MPLQGQTVLLSLTPGFGGTFLIQSYELGDCPVSLTIKWIRLLNLFGKNTYSPWTSCGCCQLRVPCTHRALQKQPSYMCTFKWDRPTSSQVYACILPLPCFQKCIYGHTEMRKQTPCTRRHSNPESFPRRARLRCISQGRSSGKSGNMTGGFREGGYPRDAPGY